MPGLIGSEGAGAPSPREREREREGRKERESKERARGGPRETSARCSDARIFRSSSFSSGRVFSSPHNFRKNFFPNRRSFKKHRFRHVRRPRLPRRRCAPGHLQGACVERGVSRRPVRGESESNSNSFYRFSPLASFFFAAAARYLPLQAPTRPSSGPSRAPSSKLWKLPFDTSSFTKRKRLERRNGRAERALKVVGRAFF